MPAARIQEEATKMTDMAPETCLQTVASNSWIVYL